jgi:hypothetical protein
MKTDHSLSNRRKKASSGILLVLVISFVWGCAGQYGRLQQDTEVTRMFETNNVPENYHYYIDGRSDMPYAIVGIIPDYRFVSRFWEPVEPNTEDFARKVAFIWRPRGWAHYTTGMGAHIYDPQGKKIGIRYSMYSSSVIRVREGNQVEVHSHGLRSRD